VLGVREETFFEAETEPHRAARHHREDDGDRLGTAVVLRAETAPDERRVHPNAVLRQLEHPAELFAQRERILRAAPHLDRVGARRRDAHERLEVEMLHPREAKLVLEDLVAAVEGCAVTGSIPPLIADVGTRPE
jgi:hypothetical protein